jgi:hypothetical protein
MKVKKNYEEEFKFVDEYVRKIFTLSKHIDKKTLLDSIYRIGDYLESSSRNFSDDYVKNQIEYLCEVEKNDKKFQKDFWKNYVKSQSETLHKNKNYDREI